MSYVLVWLHVIRGIFIFFFFFPKMQPFSLSLSLILFPSCAGWVLQNHCMRPWIPTGLTWLICLVQVSHLRWESACYLIGPFLGPLLNHFVLPLLGWMDCHLQTVCTLWYGLAPSEICLNKPQTPKIRPES